jgi:hypothetical protein
VNVPVLKLPLVETNLHVRSPQVFSYLSINVLCPASYPHSRGKISQ